MPLKYETKQATGPDGEPLVDAKGRPVMETRTQYIPGSTGSALAREYWDQNEQAYGELQQLKAERRRQLAEQAFWKRYGLVGIHK